MIEGVGREFESGEESGIVKRPPVSAESKSEVLDLF